MTTNVYPILATLVFATISSTAIADETEVIEFPRLSGAVAGAAGFGSCCSASTYITGNSSTLAMVGCETIGGYCMSERRAPVVVFDLESIPEGADIESVRLVGTRTSGVGNSGGRLHLMFTSSGSISGQLLMLNNSPHETVEINWAGSSFNYQLDTAWFTDPILDRYLMISMYSWYDSTTYVRNSTGYEPTLRVTINTPSTPCPGDLDGNDIVDASDLGIFLALWNTTNADADFNEDGIVDSSDLGLLLAGWGSCL